MSLRYTPSEYVENSAESKKAVTTSDFKRDVSVENQLISNRNNKSSKKEQRSVKPNKKSTKCTARLHFIDQIIGYNNHVFA